MIFKNRIKGLLLVVAVLCSITSKAQDKVIDQVVAVVGNNPILKSDIEQQALQMQAQGVTTAGDLKCEVLEQLLEQRLLLAEAELDTTIIVTDNQINQNLESRINYFIEHIGSEKEVEKYFKKPISQLKAEMSESIKEQLKTEQMQGKIFQKVKATPAEVRQFYKQMVKKDIPEIPALYEYAQITVLPAVSEQEDLEVKARLRDFKKRVENGDSFSALAVMYSEDPGSARNGGEMDYVGRAMLDPAFATEAFNLKPGQVSKVVKSEFGYHIIQVTGIKQKHSFAKLKSTLTDQVKQSKVTSDMVQKVLEAEFKKENISIPDKNLTKIHIK
jgi:peptidyl-prolyl cis-trans isomerase SurA